MVFLRGFIRKFLIPLSRYGSRLHAKRILRKRSVPCIPYCSSNLARNESLKRMKLFFSGTRSQKKHSPQERKQYPETIHRQPYKRTVFVIKKKPAPLLGRDLLKNTQ